MTAIKNNNNNIYQGRVYAQQNIGSQISYVNIEYSFAIRYLSREADFSDIEIIIIKEDITEKFLQNESQGDFVSLLCRSKLSSVFFRLISIRNEEGLISPIIENVKYRDDSIARDNKLHGNAHPSPLIFSIFINLMSQVSDEFTYNTHSYYEVNLSHEHDVKLSKNTPAKCSRNIINTINTHSSGSEILAIDNLRNPTIDFSGKVVSLGGGNILQESELMFVEKGDNNKQTLFSTAISHRTKTMQNRNILSVLSNKVAVLF